MIPLVTRTGGARKIEDLKRLELNEAATEMVTRFGSMMLKDAIEVSVTRADAATGVLGPGSTRIITRNLRPAGGRFRLTTRLRPGSYTVTATHPHTATHLPATRSKRLRIR